MKTKIIVIHWVPRILTIMAILFISMFALDAFAPGLPLEKQLKGFFIQMIPSLILTVMLVIAWKWEYLGGLLIMLSGIATAFWIFGMNSARTHSIWAGMVIVLMINGPFILSGYLFTLSYYLKKKNLTESQD